MMVRKWEFSRGARIITIEPQDSQGRWWRVLTLVARARKKTAYQEGGLVWVRATYRTPDRFGMGGIPTREQAEQVAREAAERLKIQYLPDVRPWSKVLTLVEGLIEGLSALE
jgi:hypothetical protein